MTDVFIDPSGRKRGTAGRSFSEYMENYLVDDLRDELAEAGSIRILDENNNLYRPGSCPVDDVTLEREQDWYRDASPRLQQLYRNKNDGNGRAVVEDPLVTPDLFISYASADREKVEAFAQAAIDRKLSVEWWKRGRLTGMDIPDWIRSMIENSKATLVFWSSSATESVYVKAEAELARTLERLVPAIIDSDMGYESIPLPHIIADTYDLRHWGGCSDDPLLVPILDAIQEKLGHAE